MSNRPSKQKLKRLRKERARLAEKWLCRRVAQDLTTSDQWARWVNTKNLTLTELGGFARFMDKSSR